MSRKDFCYGGYFVGLVYQPKQFELHLVLGEAIVTAALGPNSVESRDKWLTAEVDFKPPNLEQSEETVKKVVDVLLTEKISSQNPYIRQVCLFKVDFTIQFVISRFFMCYFCFNVQYYQNLLFV